MVVFHHHHTRPGDLHVRLRPARPAIDHQLQAKKCCAYAVSLAYDEPRSILTESQDEGDDV